MQGSTHPANWYGTWLWLVTTSVAAVVLVITIAVSGPGRSWAPVSQSPAHESSPNLEPEMEVSGLMDVSR